MSKKFTTTALLAMGTAVLFSAQASAAEMESSIARGGLLYDSWFTVIGAQKPQATHPAWPASNTKKAGNVTWRCKSCHGWDLKGKDGAYAKGSYQTGITGLTGLAGKDNAAVIAKINDSTHAMKGVMSDQDLTDLANFVTKGQFDMSKYIDYGAKKSLGDPVKGEVYYNTICARCHGADGTLPQQMEETVGALCNDNPWEILQKIMNGQPAETMPAMRAFGAQMGADILAYGQTLPSSR